MFAAQVGISLPSALGQPQCGMIFRREAKGPLLKHPWRKEPQRCRC